VDEGSGVAGVGGAAAGLPEPMFEVLVQVAAAMKAGLAVTVAPHHLLLCTQEAAELTLAGMIADTQRRGTTLAKTCRRHSWYRRGQ
jgi:hypothetical protein